MLELITNRTQSDVNYAKALRNKIINIGWENTSSTEREIYLNGPMLGEYRHGDLNRVGTAVLFLAELLNTNGYQISVIAKTDWTQNDIPRSDQMNTYIANVAAIKERFFGTVELPLTMDNISTDDANNIELALLEVDRLLYGAISIFRYTGAFEAGEDL